MNSGISDDTNVLEVEIPFSSGFGPHRLPATASRNLRSSVESRAAADLVINYFQTFCRSLLSVSSASSEPLRSIWFLFRSLAEFICGPLSVSLSFTRPSEEPPSFCNRPPKKWVTTSHPQNGSQSFVLMLRGGATRWLTGRQHRRT